MLSDYEKGPFKLVGVFRLGKPAGAGQALDDSVQVYAYNGEFSRQYKVHHLYPDSPADLNVYYYDDALQRWIKTGKAPRVSDSTECDYFKFEVKRMGYYQLGYDEDERTILKEKRTAVQFKSRLIRKGTFFIADPLNGVNEKVDTKGRKKFSQDIDMRTKHGIYLTGSYTKNNKTRYLHIRLDKMRIKGKKYVIRKKDFSFNTNRANP